MLCINKAQFLLSASPMALFVSVRVLCFFFSNALSLKMHNGSALRLMRTARESSMSCSEVLHEQTVTETGVEGGAV